MEKMIPCDQFMKLVEDQRKKLAGIFIDAGKIIFAALVVSQFVPKNLSEINIFVAISAFVISILCFIIGLLFEKPKK